jgi:heme oxygenase
VRHQADLDDALGATTEPSADRTIRSQTLVRPPVSVRSASAEIRRATAAAHRSVEAATDLMSPQLTVERYGSLLAAFGGIHRTLDRQVGQIVSGEPWSESLAVLVLPQRAKMASLTADLNALGRMPEPAVQFSIFGVAAALGAVYVCEGATLGGRVITPHLRRLFGPDVPVAYFNSYGDDVHRMWALCRRAIDRLLITDGDIGRASNTANGVFGLFERAAG